MKPHTHIHPRTVGWFGTTSVAMGGINQSLFLLSALFIGQGAIPRAGQRRSGVAWCRLALKLGGDAWLDGVDSHVSEPRRRDRGNMRGGVSAL